MNNLDRGIHDFKDDRNSLITESVELYEELLKCKYTPYIQVTVSGAACVKIYTQRTKAENWFKRFTIDCIRTSNFDLLDDDDLKRVSTELFHHNYDKFLEDMEYLVDGEKWKDYIDSL